MPEIQLSDLISGLSLEPPLSQLQLPPYVMAFGCHCTRGSYFCTYSASPFVPAPTILSGSSSAIESPWLDREKLQALLLRAINIDLSQILLTTVFVSIPTIIFAFGPEASTLP
jgi:hypothetical protein